MNAARDLVKDSIAEAIRTLGAEFDKQEVGAPAATTIEYVPYVLVKRELPDLRALVELDALPMAIINMVHEVMQDIRAAREAKRGQGALHLVWRHFDKIVADIDYARPGGDLRIRCRFAIVSDWDRQHYRNQVQSITRHLDVPRARLYSDDDLALLKMQTAQAAAAQAHDQYWRIPLIGLYVHDGWLPLRLWTRIRRWQGWRLWPEG